MSRVGKKLINIPKDVEIKITDAPGRPPMSCCPPNYLGLTQLGRPINLRHAPQGGWGTSVRQGGTSVRRRKQMPARRLVTKRTQCDKGWLLEL